MRDESQSIWRGWTLPGNHTVRGRLRTAPLAAQPSATQGEGAVARRSAAAPGHHEIVVSGGQGRCDAFGGARLVALCDVGFVVVEIQVDVR